MTKALYPKISPYHQEWLAVDDFHQLYIEQSGNPDGIAVVYLHGGPGEGSCEDHRRYFDPEKYRIILFDQRGCGRSKPSPSIIDNTTEHLIRDLEQIRQHLNIEKWLVAGGSWGTTLALAYGIKHSEQILAFILRGIFLGTQQEFDWLFQPQGAARFYPDYYRKFSRNIGIAEDDILNIYQDTLSGNNELASIAASKTWYLWGRRLSSMEPLDTKINLTLDLQETHRALCMAKISCHYFTQQCFITEGYLLDNLHKLTKIPAIILHGRYDMACQLVHAHALAQLWPNARLQILPKAGHSGFEKQTIDAFCQATDSMATFLNEQH